MAEKETVFSSGLSYTGIFNFKEFYKFCYNWLMDETNMDGITEEKYSEKIEGDSKKIEVKWVGTKDMTDYFRFEIKVSFDLGGLRNVEVSEGGIKVETNKGLVRMKISGILVRDYKGKFETSASKKFMRELYEKWVITERLEEFRSKIAGDCDEFLMQAKAYLNLEASSK